MGAQATAPRSVESGGSRLGGPRVCVFRCASGRRARGGRCPRRRALGGGKGRVRRGQGLCRRLRRRAAPLAVAAPASAWCGGRKNESASTQAGQGCRVYVYSHSGLGPVLARGPRARAPQAPQECRSGGPAGGGAAGQRIGARARRAGGRAKTVAARGGAGAPPGPRRIVGIKRPAAARAGQWATPRVRSRAHERVCMRGLSVAGSGWVCLLGLECARAFGGGSPCDGSAFSAKGRRANDAENHRFRGRCSTGGGRRRARAARAMRRAPGGARLKSYVDPSAPGGPESTCAL
jgi:hypothetical protein